MRKPAVFVQADPFIIRPAALLGTVHRFQDLPPPFPLLRIAVSAAVKSGNSAHIFISFFRTGHTGIFRLFCQIHYSSLNHRLILPLLQRHLRGRYQHLGSGSHGIGLFLRIILTEGNKKDVFYIHQDPDIFHIHAKGIVC